MASSMIILSCNDDDKIVDDTPESINIYEGCCGTTPFEFTNDVANIYIPSMVTVNNDGINDLFGIYMNNVDRLENVEIRSHSDSLLFELSTLDTQNERDNLTWSPLTPTGTIYKGALHYQMTAIDTLGNSINIVGTSCSFTCDTPAYSVLDNVLECSYATQYNNYEYDPGLSHLDTNCLY